MTRYLVWGASWLFILLVLVTPPAMVLTEALKAGLAASLATLSDPDAQSAIWLPLQGRVVAVVLNTIFGILAAWVLVKFRFPGRQFLQILVELPLSISPVVSGLVWLLLFGAQGWFGPLLERWNIHIAFAVPDRAAQLQVRSALLDTGYQVTPVIDRDYFWAIYFRTPGGVLFEIATDEPGFTRDEPAATLGRDLKLPQQHEHLRSVIAAHLEPIID